MELHMYTTFWWLQLWSLLWGSNPLFDITQWEQMQVLLYRIKYEQISGAKCWLNTIIWMSHILLGMLGSEL